MTITTLREVLNWDERGGCNGDLGQAHLHRGGQEGNTADPEKLLEMMLGLEMLLAVSFWWEK